MAAVNPIEVLKARAFARAKLWAEGYLDFHDAVDRLTYDACNLAAEIGQDAVQLIIAEAFGRERERLEEPKLPMPELRREQRQPEHLAASTIAAIRYLLRYGDIESLTRFTAAHGEPERSFIVEYVAKHRKRK
jgi:hypothetical protein